MRLPRLGSSEKQCMKSVWNGSRAAAGLFKAIASQAFSWGLQPPSPCSRTFSKFWRPQNIIYVCVETMSNLCVSLLLLSCWTCYCSHHKVLFLSAWPCKMNGTGLHGHKRDKSAGTIEAVAVCQCHLRYHIVITHLSSTGMFPTPLSPKRPCSLGGWKKWRWNTLSFSY